MVKPIEILLVEDDAGDVDLVKEALREKKINVNLNVTNDGVDALRYLYKRGPYAGAARPDVILLDLNLPRKDGREVLRNLKSDKTLRPIPVVVLSTSTAETDILNAYGLGANCYVTKPTEYHDFANAVAGVIRFWSTVLQPSNGTARKDHGKIKILLIEDDDGDADLLQELLSEIKDTSFQIERAGTLQAGLDRLAREESAVDLVLLDLFLPDGQGLDTFTKFQSGAPQAPVVILSGLNDESLAIETVRQGSPRLPDQGAPGRISPLASHALRRGTVPDAGNDTPSFADRRSDGAAQPARLFYSGRTIFQPRPARTKRVPHRLR